MLDFNFNKYKKLIIIVIAIVIVIAVAGVTWLKVKKSTTGKTACTTEAKVCPDGSTVSRSGPNCKFKACPDANKDRVTIHTYTVEKDMKISCKTDGECMLPKEYAAMSRCKFSTLCLNNTCNVICPTTIRTTNELLLEYKKYEEEQAKKANPEAPVAPKK